MRVFEVGLGVQTLGVVHVPSFSSSEIKKRR